jgi:chromosome segregation ATPase
MSSPSLDQIRGSKAPSVTELVSETRIDSPHSPANTARFEEAVAADTAGLDRGVDLEPWGGEEPSSPPPDPEAISRQVQAQAAQLAERLRARQQELDHREAELNAWAAQLERDTRAARLWLDERNAELEEAAQPAETIVLQEDAIRRMAEALAERQRRLAESEAELEAQRAALQDFHEHLTTDRQLLEEQSQAQRERLAADQLRLAAEMEQKRREVQQRSEQADQAHAALEQFRAELGRMHRETLEIRLATEELWAELSGSAPSAALTRSLGRIRSRLADHYRTANLELHQKKEELERLRGQLSQQYEKLVRQKGDFDVWAAQCREEVEQQAARLVAQGEDLERREADMGEYARRTQAEKLELQQEIRRLRAKLAKAEVELPI